MVVAKVRDATTGEELAAVPLGVDWVGAHAFSPDGQRLAAVISGGGDTRRVRVWDLEAGKELLTFGVDGMTSGLAFSPDGKRLVTSGNDGHGNNAAWVWDAATGEEVASCRGYLPGESAGAALAPDGKRLVTGGGNESRGEVAVWDAATGDEALVLRGFPKVTAVAFSPDGHRIAAACADGTIRVWDGTPVEESRFRLSPPAP
jgi:WD40 repeat protein